MDKKLKHEWEARSKELKDNPKSVMFATFPPDLNKSLHDWELKILKKHFPKISNPHVLDVGAGYGRLSIPLSKKHKTAYFHGMDIAEGFVKLYNLKMGKHGEAKVASLTKLPYKENQFDYIFVVTVLMYLSNKEIKESVNELKRVLKPNGKLILIENHKSGTNYITAFGLSNKIKKLLKKTNKNYITSREFQPGEIEHYFNKSFKLRSKEKCSMITLIIPFYLILSKIGVKLGIIKNYIDLPFLPTLYEAYVFENF